MEVSPQHANGDAGGQERLRRSDHANDPDKGAGQRGVVGGGGGMQPGQVGADKPDLQGSASGDAGEDQVAAGDVGITRILRCGHERAQIGSRQHHRGHARREQRPPQPGILSPDDPRGPDESAGQRLQLLVLGLAGQVLR
jgi:hypothetical protein